MSSSASTIRTFGSLRCSATQPVETRTSGWAYPAVESCVSVAVMVSALTFSWRRYPVFRMSCGKIVSSPCDKPVPKTSSEVYAHHHIDAVVDQLREFTNERIRGWLVGGETGLVAFFDVGGG